MALFPLLQSLVFFSNNFLCVSGTVLEFFISQLVLCDSPSILIHASFLRPWAPLLTILYATLQPWALILHVLFLQPHMPFHGAFLPTCISFQLLTNYHKLYSLKQHTFMISQFPWVKSWAQLIWVLCTRSLKATVMVSARLYSHPRLGWGRIHFQVHPGWQSSFPCGRQIEGPRFLLAVCWRPLSVLKCHL